MPFWVIKDSYRPFRVKWDVNKILGLHHNCQNLREIKLFIERNKFLPPHPYYYPVDSTAHLA